MIYYAVHLNGQSVNQQKMKLAAHRQQFELNMGPGKESLESQKLESWYIVSYTIQNFKKMDWRKRTINKQAQLRQMAM